MMSSHITGRLVSRCIVAIAIIAACFASRAANAQANRSHTSGWSVGLGREAWYTHSLTPAEGNAVRESGNGWGLEVGYGFGQRLAMNAIGHRTTIIARDGLPHTMVHVVLGPRLHLDDTNAAIVPWAQLGLSIRSQDYRFTDEAGRHFFSAQGSGVGAGVGVNAHVQPGFALTMAAQAETGMLSDFVQDKTITGKPARASSVSLRFAVLWYPGV